MSEQQEKVLQNTDIVCGGFLFFLGLQSYLQYAPMNEQPVVQYTGDASANQTRNAWNQLRLHRYVWLFFEYAFGGCLVWTWTKQHKGFLFWRTKNFLGG